MNETPTKEDFAKWSRVWHDTCETMTTLLGLPGCGSPQEMLAQVQHYVSTRGVAQEAPEPVAWRWKPRGAVNWIYDPSPEWRLEHQDSIDVQPLYAGTSPLPSTTLGGEAREKEITRLATIEECARLAENTGLRNPENIARDIRALALTSTHHETP